MHKNDWPKHAKLLQPQAYLGPKKHKNWEIFQIRAPPFSSCFPVLVTNLNGKLFSRGGIEILHQLFIW